MSAPNWPPEEVAAFQEQWRPSEDALAEEIAAMRGSWWGEIVYRVPSVVEFQLVFIPFHMFWRACGCMLLGMALFKWGLLSGVGSRRLYGTLAVIGLLVGLPLTAMSIQRQIASDWAPIYCFFLGNQYAYWGAIPISLGYISIVMLFLRANVWPALANRLAAVGRMAFTNYLVQTLICTTLFYGRGFGLFGQVERVGQIGIVLAIWILQLAYSPIWLRHFRFGPMEWLWRSLSYRSRQPMRYRS